MIKPPLEKIQKVLAQSGLGSRRQIERWITEGRINVNGQAAVIGQRISTRVKVQFDGKPVKLLNQQVEQSRVLVYHKPAGEICSRHDPQKRTTVFTKLPPIDNGRWISVGRLDINTSGLLLFTNDGSLANQLMHPRQAIEREYAVRVFGLVDDEMLDRLTAGVKLDDGMARFEHVVSREGRGQNRWFYVVVVAGRNRLVRRLWESQDVKVSRLARVRFGPIIMPRSLSEGHWLELPDHRVQQLKDAVSENTRD